MFKFLTVLAPSNPPDFALGTISPITMGTGETASPLVTVNSVSGFSAAVAERLGSPKRRIGHI